MTEDAPHRKARTKRDHRGLQGIGSEGTDFHRVPPLLPFGTENRLPEYSARIENTRKKTMSHPPKTGI